MQMCPAALKSLINLTLAIVVLAAFVNPFGKTAGAALNIIPTPKHVAEGEGAIRLDQGTASILMVLSDAPAGKETAAANYFNQRLRDLYHLPELTVVKLSALDSSAATNCDLILIGNAARHALIGEYQELLKDDIEFLRKQTTDQAYVIRVLKNRANPRRSVVVLSGRGDQGTLYAAVTFGQMIRKHQGAWAVSCADIRDYPEFEERWIKFRSADDALAAKVTISPFLNLSVASMLSVKAGEKCLAINRRGREIGVRPVTSPCTMMDMGLQNRRSYPTGEIYECIGTLDDRDKTFGFCPSNLELRRLKTERLRDLVSRTEPGALYLHHEDYDTYATAQAAWKNRCAECRSRWPSDDLESEQGQAGAFAENLNIMLAAIFSVKNDSGYLAAKDCLVGLVVPPYTRWSEPDEIWDREAAFYVALSRRLNFVENVQFILREQGPRQDGTQGRFLELNQRLREQGKGHQLWAYVHGGDRRTTWRNWPVRHKVPFGWICSPVFLGVNRGVSTLFLAGGTHPLMKAEYAWNTRPEGGFWVETKTFQEYYAAISRFYGAVYVPEIFERGALFDRVYQNLYGEQAGQSAADGLRPAVFRGGVIFPVPGTAWLGLIDPVWSLSDSSALHGKWRELFARQAEANQRAIGGLQKALACDDLPPGRAEDLREQLNDHERGLAWAELAGNEAAYYLSVLNGETNAAVFLANLHGALDRMPKEEKAFATARRKRLNEAAAKVQAVVSYRELHSLKLDELRQKAPDIQDRIRKELRVRPGYNVKGSVGPLGYIRMAVVGGGSGLKRFLDDKNFGWCKFVKGLGPEIMDYDVVCYGGIEKLAEDENDLLRNFVLSGGGLLLVGGAPAAMAGGADLTPIADWLGTAQYGNIGGTLAVPAPSFISQGAEEWLGSFEAGKGTAALLAPLTGLPLLTFAGNPNAAFLFANKFGSGRVVFAATAGIPDELLYKLILWLGHNKIDATPDYLADERHP